MTYRSKNTRLGDICAIQTGYTARSRLEPVGTGGVPAVQLRDLPDSGEFDPDSVPMYQLVGGFERYWAEAGDVLFRSRGDNNTAVVVSGRSSGAAVAVLPLLVLKANRALLKPEYLAWFINQPTAQRHFDSCARGTRMRMIPRPCLESLEVAVPDLDTQRQLRL